MPSSSQAQHNFMEMLAHNAGQARKHGVPASVAKEFVSADKKSGKFRGKKRKKQPYHAGGKR
jgi:hypothetical protein